MRLHERLRVFKCLRILRSQRSQLITLLGAAEMEYVACLDVERFQHMGRQDNTNALFGFRKLKRFRHSGTSQKSRIAVQLIVLCEQASSAQPPCAKSAIVGVVPAGMPTLWIQPPPSTSSPS